MTANKLPPALRAAMTGGFYDEGSLRHDLVLAKDFVTEDLRALNRLGEIGDVDDTLFGWHNGDESDDWPVPTLNFRVFNEDGRYTPGGAAPSVLPKDITGWTVEESLYERITSASWTKFYAQTWLLAEVQLAQGTATFLCTHPLQGMLEFEFAKSLEHAVNWDGWPHNVIY